LVRQHRKYISQTRREEDDDIDFFVVNPHPRAQGQVLPFVLASPDLAGIERAVVVVKGWHTETFSTARLTSAPKIFRFVEPRVFQQAARDRKSTRLNSSHVSISYAVFCFKTKSATRATT